MKKSTGKRRCSFSAASYFFCLFSFFLCVALPQNGQYPENISPTEELVFSPVEFPETDADDSNSLHNSFYPNIVTEKRERESSLDDEVLRHTAKVYHPVRGRKLHFEKYDPKGFLFQDLLSSSLPARGDPVIRTETVAEMLLQCVFS